jgi:hypothetical protein
MAPQAHQEGGHEWIFVRFYDFDLDGSLVFNVLTLERDGTGPWAQRHEATRLHPWSQPELSNAIVAAGFTDVTWYGDMKGNPFDLHSSPNAIVAAKKS